MGLQLFGGELLAVGSELANHSDCCCEGGCCQFTPCVDGDILLGLCPTAPDGLEIGEVLKIGDVCYTYDGIVNCVGGESTQSLGQKYSSCEVCEEDCVCPDLPNTLTVSFPTTARIPGCGGASECYSCPGTTAYSCTRAGANAWQPCYYYSAWTSIGTCCPSQDPLRVHWHRAQVAVTAGFITARRMWYWDSTGIDPNTDDSIGGLASHIFSKSLSDCPASGSHTLSTVTAGTGSGNYPCAQQWSGLSATVIL